LRANKVCKGSRGGIDYTGWSPLLIAAADTSAEYATDAQRAMAVRVLLQFGAKIHAIEPSTQGYTALHLAADRGYRDVVLCLLNGGADVDRVSSVLQKHTALHRAAHCGREGSAQVLLEHGADPHLLSATGETPLQMCIKQLAKCIYAVDAQQYLRTARLLQDYTRSCDWIRLPGDPDVGEGHTAAVNGQQILVFGGGSAANKTYSNTLHVYDCANNAWQSPGVRGTPPGGRRYHAACIVQDIEYSAPFPLRLCSAPLPHVLAIAVASHLF
jgi:hypothetical protein